MTTSLTPLSRYTCGNLQSSQSRYTCGNVQGLTTRFTCGNTQSPPNRYVYAITWTWDMGILTFDQGLTTDVAGQTVGWTWDGTLFTGVLP